MVEAADRSTRALVRFLDAPAAAPAAGVSP
jgi:hypothetical protein